MSFDKSLELHTHTPIWFSALQVFDVGNETLVPEAQLNQYPSTEADIHVEVILRPKIDVYPASTTLVKSQVITIVVSTSNAL